MLSSPPEIVNVCLTDYGKTIDLEKSVIKNETLNYEVFKPSLNRPWSPIYDNSTTSNISMGNVNDAEADESNTLPADKTSPFVQKVMKTTEIRDKSYKNSFKGRVLLKVNSDLKS